MSRNCASNHQHPKNSEYVQLQKILTIYHQLFSLTLVLFINYPSSNCPSILRASLITSNTIPRAPFSTLNRTPPLRWTTRPRNRPHLLRFQLLSSSSLSLLSNSFLAFSSSRRDIISAPLPLSPAVLLSPLSPVLNIQLVQFLDGG
jgi:hypothetical protein